MRAFPSGILSVLVFAALHAVAGAGGLREETRVMPADTLGRESDTLGRADTAGTGGQAAISGKSAGDSAASLASPVARAMAEGYLEARPSGMQGVDKGPLFILSRIVLDGPKPFTLEAMGLLAYPGQPASAERLRSISAAVKAYLLDHGHPFGEARLDFTVREGSPAVDLRIHLVPGPGYKYGGTKQSGSRTKPVTLERLGLLQYGEDYSESRRLLATGKLARTGYFDAVIPGPLYRDSSRNLIYPGLALSDRKGNRLSGILGYDSEQGAEGGGGLDGYLDIHLINMRGTARDLDFNFESKSSGEGRAEKEIRFAYVEPWLLGTPLGGRLALDVTLQDSAYEERNADFALFQDMGFRSRYSVHFGAQDNRDILADMRSSAITTGIGLAFDARDRVPGTLRGMLLDGKVTGLRRELEDSSYYLAQGTGSAGLWANRGRWVAHALLTAGGDWPLAERANRGELFELGGANTIRGYREKEFLTDLYGYANLELQFLLAPFSRAALFAVPGLVNRLGGEVHWQWVLGYGAGLEAGGKEWTFGVSYALNPDRAIGDGFVHLRVTNNF